MQKRKLRSFDETRHLGSVPGTLLRSYLLVQLRKCAFPANKQMMMMMLMTVMVMVVMMTIQVDNSQPWYVALAVLVCFSLFVQMAEAGLAEQTLRYAVSRITFVDSLADKPLRAPLTASCPL